MPTTKAIALFPVGPLNAGVLKDAIRISVKRIMFPKPSKVIMGTPAMRRRTAAGAWLIPTGAKP